MEQLRRGCKLSRAIETSINQVYIQSRYNKEEQSVVRSIRSQQFGNTNGVELQFSRPSVVSSMELSHHSLLSIISQQGSLLEQLIHQDIQCHVYALVTNNTTRDELLRYVAQHPRHLITFSIPLLNAIFSTGVQEIHVGSVQNDQPNEQWLVIAARYLLEMLSLGDHKVRLRWLQLQLHSHPSLRELFQRTSQQLFQTPLVEMAKQLLNKMETISGKSFQFQPLGARALELVAVSRVGHQELNSLYFTFGNLVMRLHLATDRILRTCMEQESYNAAGTVGHSKLSPVVQSYQFYHHQLDKTRLAHDVIPLFYPFFRYLDTFISSLLQETPLELAMPIQVVLSCFTPHCCRS